MARRRLTCVTAVVVGWLAAGVSALGNHQVCHQAAAAEPVPTRGERVGRVHLGERREVVSGHIQSQLSDQKRQKGPSASTEIMMAFLFIFSFFKQ